MGRLKKYRQTSTQQTDPDTSGMVAARHPQAQRRLIHSRLLLRGRLLRERPIICFYVREHGSVSMTGQ